MTCRLPSLAKQYGYMFAEREVDAVSASARWKRKVAADAAP